MLIKFLLCFYLLVFPFPSPQELEYPPVDLGRWLIKCHESMRTWMWVPRTYVKKSGHGAHLEVETGGSPSLALGDFHVQ